MLSWFSRSLGFSPTTVSVVGEHTLAPTTEDDDTLPTAATSSKGMSYCRQSGDGGKDVVIMVTEDDHNLPLTDQVAKVVDELVDEYETAIEGPLKPNGEINWACPCMASMVSGPCGYEFRQAFQCYHDSSAETKGLECFQQFNMMRDCFGRHPVLYAPATSDADDAPSTPDPFSQTEEQIDHKLDRLRHHAATDSL